MEIRNQPYLNYKARRLYLASSTNLTEKEVSPLYDHVNGEIFWGKIGEAYKALTWNHVQLSRLGLDFIKKLAFAC